MPYNLDFANKIIKNYKLDALIATDVQTLKYFEFDFWVNSAKEWMFTPGGSNKNAINNFCIIQYNKKPVYVLVSSAATFLKNFEKKISSEVILFQHFNDLDEKKNRLEFKNKKEQKISNIMIKDGIFENSISALCDTLKKLNLDSSRIGLEISGISKKALEDIKMNLRFCNIYKADELFRLIRMVKTKEELKIIKECSEITELALLKSIESIKSSESLSNAYLNYNKTIFEKSALFEHYTVFPYGLGLFDGRDYIIGNEMICGIDVGSVYKNYVSDTGLTLFIGNCGRNYYDEYKKILTVMEAGLNSVIPGDKCSKIYKSMGKKRNEYNLNNLLFGGHGIGLSFREYPIIKKELDFYYDDGFSKKSADFTIEKNMVFNIEATNYGFNEKTIHIEKTLFVADNGFEELKFQNRSKPLNIKI